MKPKTAACQKTIRSTAGHSAKTAQTSPSPHMVSGICAGAMVMTLHGLRPIQTLSSGDALVTRSCGAAPLLRVEEHYVVTRAVYVIAGSLGHYQLDRDTLLPAAQTVLVRDWRARFIGRADAMLVTAQELLDGEFVRDLGFVPMTLYRLICERQQVIYADGMELGTADATTRTPWTATPR